MITFDEAEKMSDREFCRRMRWEIAKPILRLIGLIGYSMAVWYLYTRAPSGGP